LQPLLPEQPRERQTLMQADVPADDPGDREDVQAGVPADDPDGREDVPDGRDGAQALLPLHRRCCLYRRREPGAANRDGSAARRFRAPCH